MEYELVTNDIWHQADMCRTECPYFWHNDNWRNKQMKCVHISSPKLVLLYQQCIWCMIPRSVIKQFRGTAPTKEKHIFWRAASSWKAKELYCSYNSALEDWCNINFEEGLYEIQATEIRFSLWKYPHVCKFQTSCKEILHTKERHIMTMTIWCFVNSGTVCFHT